MGLRTFDLSFDDLVVNRVYEILTLNVADVVQFAVLRLLKTAETRFNLCHVLADSSQLLLG